MLNRLSPLPPFFCYWYVCVDTAGRSVTVSQSSSLKEGTCDHTKGCWEKKTFTLAAEICDIHEPVS